MAAFGPPDALDNLPRRCWPGELCGLFLMGTRVLTSPLHVAGPRVVPAAPTTDRLRDPWPAVGSSHPSCCSATRRTSWGHSHLAVLECALPLLPYQLGRPVSPVSLPSTSEVSWPNSRQGLEALRFPDGGKWQPTPVLSPTAPAIWPRGSHW